ncbi:diablo, IAP-binding mitochondrial protein b [Brachyhypopomus gauderio]|uniref:diablo, IAP-binding mitochondrial protein b n=1 Tax=Brachyhypopomus gauderio TaxID=698409 RepID=UPI004042B557
MALYRRKAVAFARCAASLVNATRMPYKLVRLPSLIKKNWVSLSIYGGLCAVPVVQDKVSHEALIRRASSLVTDSANTFLSQTTLALVDSLTQYTKAIHTLINVHRDYVENINKLNPAEEEAIWQVIVHQRKELIDRRENCKQFETNWMIATNLSQVAAEAAFNAGADHASATTQSNLQMAQSHVKQAQLHSLEAENELKDCKAEDSKRLQKGVSTMMGEEEEVPEAYLRED